MIHSIFISRHFVGKDGLYIPTAMLAGDALSHNSRLPQDKKMIDLKHCIS